jgi:uncharacterized protein YndB with AHSA1/START domain
MTKNKAQKRATRARMAKTGERYTAARRHVVKPRDEVRLDHLGQTDASLRENTGKGWREWLRILDAWGSRERQHGDVVNRLLDEYGVPGWWAQSITVGYERARGLRAKHQTLSGSFQVSVSKTFPIGVGKLFKAFTETSRRNKWLERETLKVRTTQKERTARFNFRDGSSRVVAFFDPKDRTKTTVTVQHENLPDADAVEDMRAMWKERLARLADLLQG